jgi:signal transduction histidine kinase
MSTHPTDLTTLANILLSGRESIIDVWTRKASERVPSCGRVSEPALRNALVELLEVLGEALKSNSAEATQKAQAEDEAVARHHGLQRFDLDAYDIVDIVEEYRLLRQVVFDTLFVYSTVLDRTAVQTVNKFFDRAIAQACGTFSDLHVSALHADLNAAEQQAENAVRSEKDTAAALQESKGSLARLGNTMEAKDQFVSFLSHDLRSPLSAITLTAHNMLRKATDPTLRTKIERILNATQRADGMVQHFLERNRVDADHPLFMDVEETDFAKTLRHLKQELDQQYGDRFVLTCPDALTVYWDGKAVERAVENLCSNAVKYGSEDASIRISVISIEDRIEIGVANRGKPISGADQRRLFKPYYRASSAAETAKQGWGLGLAYVWQVAQLHGGKIAVSSTSEAGTEFTLALPSDIRNG